VNSRLYTGKVSHHRSRPKENSFAYQVYFVLLDLEEVDGLDASLRRFSHNRFNLTALYDRDHGPRDGSPLRPWIDALLARESIDLAGGRVELLCFPRVLGLKFYPVSFWYCYHADGQVRAVLAEVQNTVGGHHNYLLHNNGAPFNWDSRPEVCKVFYVSPFIEMDARYEFAFTRPDQRLQVGIYDYVTGPLLLTARLDLEAQELTDDSLSRAVRRFGPMSLRAWVLILSQALNIMRKGIRYLPPKPMPKEETTTK
jgi:uncharacterized protein